MRAAVLRFTKANHFVLADRFLNEPGNDESTAAQKRKILCAHSLSFASLLNVIRHFMLNRALKYKYAKFKKMYKGSFWVTMLAVRHYCFRIPDCLFSLNLECTLTMQIQIPVYPRSFQHCCRRLIVSHLKKLSLYILYQF